MGDLTINWPDASRDRVVEASQRLDESRESLLGCPLERLVEAVGMVIERFRKPSEDFGARLVADLPEVTGFSPETVATGLEHALAGWDADAVRALFDLELGPSLRVGRMLRPYECTSVVLGGSIPMPTFVACLTPLLVRSPVLAKTAARDRLTAHLVAECLREIDAELGACLEVLDLDGDDEAGLDAFLAAPLVVASGSDEALREIAERASAGHRLVGYGHKFSVALIDAAGCTGEALEVAATDFAIDVAAWDQAGCLSPMCAHVVGGPQGAAEQFANMVAEGLAELAESQPRGTVTTETAARIRNERDGAAMRAAGGQSVAVSASDDTAWTVVLEDGPELRDAPGQRFVRIHPTADLESWVETLAPHSAHLSSVGYAGHGDERDHPALGLASALGASRVCPVGDMQAPPLDWPHDGEPVLLPLARWTGFGEIT